MTVATAARAAGPVELQLGAVDAASGRLTMNPSAISSNSTLHAVLAIGHDAELLALADEWRRATALSSSTTEKAMHPAYQRIIGAGWRAVPFILRELERRAGHWFWALAAITRENPVPEHSRGNVREMTDAWLRWGRERGLI